MGEGKRGVNDGNVGGRELGMGGTEGRVTVGTGVENRKRLAAGLTEARRGEKVDREKGEKVIQLIRNDEDQMNHGASGQLV